MTDKHIEGMSEEEFIEECRKKYRAKMCDVNFVVRKKVQAMASRIYPNNMATADNFRNAVYTFIRTRFKLRRMTFAPSRDKDEIFLFIDELEKLVKPKESDNMSGNSKERE